MNKKKTKINIIFIIIVILLIVTGLMIKFEINPISYFIDRDNDDDNQLANATINYNGVYRYTNSLKDSYKLFNGCTLSYFDYYIVILNDNYYRYKYSCVGTFFLDEGKTKDLKIEKTLEKNVYILFDNNQYFKTDLVNTINVGNYYSNNLKKNSKLVAENYHILMKESQLPGRYFNITKASMDVGNVSFPFSLNVSSDNKFTVNILRNKSILYTYTVDDLDNLPLFMGFGNNLTVIEPITFDERNNYTFKVYNQTDLLYDLATKFPIIVDGETLTYNENIYIKYSSSDNAFVVLVSNNSTLCEKNSESTDVAYYEFHIKYNYVEKNFDNPKFIKKVYKNEGCSNVEKLMEG